MDGGLVVGRARQVEVEVTLANTSQCVASARSKRFVGYIEYPAGSSKMASKWESDEEIQYFREYLRIPSVHPNPDYGEFLEDSRCEVFCANCSLNFLTTKSVKWEFNVPNIFRIKNSLIAEFRSSC